MKTLNQNTLMVLRNLNLVPDRLTISGYNAPDSLFADSLFHPSTRYTEIERIGTGMIYGFGRQRERGARLKESIALAVKGVSHIGEDFSVCMQYFRDEEVVVGEKDLKRYGYGKIDLVMSSGLKRLEDHFYGQQELQKPGYNSSYRSRQEIKR